MRERSRRLIAALLVWACLFALCGGSARAEGEAETPAGYWDVRVYLDGLLSGRALCTDDGTVYLAVEDMCALLGIQTETWWNADTQELIVSGSDFVLRAVAGQEYFSVNSRYLYDPRGFFLFDGRSWFPMDDIERIFGGTPTLSEDWQSLEIHGDALGVMPGGAAWYYDHFGSPEIFWLARIIHAEAGNQPLAGRMGVGNVVLNRVASDKYPDEVFGVVFDDKFSVQFDPAASGSVYREPDALDVIAACLCLEGYNTVGESMYFVNASISDDSWFRSTKEFVVRIGDHDFYKLKSE